MNQYYLGLLIVIIIVLLCIICNSNSRLIKVEKFEDIVILQLSKNKQINDLFGLIILPITEKSVFYNHEILKKTAISFFHTNVKMMKDLDIKSHIFKSAASVLAKQSPLLLNKPSPTDISSFNWLILNTSKPGDPNNFLKTPLKGTQIIGGFHPNSPPIFNQGGCGQCWSVAVTTCLSDKFSLASNLPNPILDPTTILSCCCANDMLNKALNDIGISGAGIKNCGCKTITNTDFKSNCCGKGTAGRCNGGSVIAAAWAASVVGLVPQKCQTSNTDHTDSWNQNQEDSSESEKVPGCVYPFNNKSAATWCKNKKSPQQNDDLYNIGIYYAESKTKPEYCRWFKNSGAGKTCPGVNLIADPTIINTPYPQSKQEKLVEAIKTEIALYGPIPGQFFVMSDFSHAWKGSSMGTDISWDNTNGIYLPYFMDKNNKLQLSYKSTKTPQPKANLLKPNMTSWGFDTASSKTENILNYENNASHAICICGWGVDDSLTQINGQDIYNSKGKISSSNPVQYWIVRNSWGSQLSPNVNTKYMDNIPPGCYKVAMWPFFNWGYDVPLYCNSTPSGSGYTSKQLYGGCIQVRAQDDTIYKICSSKGKKCDGHNPQPPSPSPSSSHKIVKHPKINIGLIVGIVIGSIVGIIFLTYLLPLAIVTILLKKQK